MKANRSTHRQGRESESFLERIEDKELSIISSGLRVHYQIVQHEQTIELASKGPGR